jgi:hypothetical protein
MLIHFEVNLTNFCLLAKSKRVNLRWHCIAAAALDSAQEMGA